MTRASKIPNTSFTLGQCVHCQPLGEDGQIVGHENEGFILIIDLLRGGTQHVPAGDCVLRERNTAAASRELITQVARKYLGIDTLQTRHRDSLDFHEISVWQLAKALQAAYDAGRVSRKNPKKEA
jgi:hypothetical protein